MVVTALAELLDSPLVLSPRLDSVPADGDSPLVEEDDDSPASEAPALVASDDWLGEVVVELVVPEVPCPAAAFAAAAFLSLLAVADFFEAAESAGSCPEAS